ncbi:hypothetical protein CSKR_203421 [Clonorchis sinensis]|uniref:Uncharacterized protein n=1 Tax=Clonorchis sinensis TaxID=79923 RepID=A0A8T1MA06_CLOSI|nr:hypothetical protein CSKR_203421 [Clonorchis sinensis]
MRSPKPFFMVACLLLLYYSAALAIIGDTSVSEMDKPEPDYKLLAEIVTSSPEALRMYMRFLSDWEKIAARPRYG